MPTSPRRLRPIEQGRGFTSESASVRVRPLDLGEPRAVAITSHKHPTFPFIEVRLSDDDEGGIRVQSTVDGATMQRGYSLLLAGVRKCAYSASWSGGSHSEAAQSPQMSCRECGLRSCWISSWMLMA